MEVREKDCNSLRSWKYERTSDGGGMGGGWKIEYNKWMEKKEWMDAMGIIELN